MMPQETLHEWRLLEVHHATAWALGRGGLKWALWGCLAAGVGALLTGQGGVVMNLRGEARIEVAGQS
jgi:hypothetical protein